MTMVRRRQNTLFCHTTTLPLMLQFVLQSYHTKVCQPSVQFHLSSFIVMLGFLSWLRLILSIWFCILQTVALIFKYTAGGVGYVTDSLMNARSPPHTLQIFRILKAFNALCKILQHNHVCECACGLGADARGTSV